MARDGTRDDAKNDLLIHLKCDVSAPMFETAFCEDGRSIDWIEDPGAARVSDLAALLTENGVIWSVAGQGVDQAGFYGQVSVGNLGAIWL